jgi:GNAT superfamily N-acetyltransferase
VEDVPQVVMSQPDYKIVHVTPKDTEKVLENLRRSFFLEEPLNICIQLLGENGDEDCHELEDYCRQSIQEGLSLMAVSACGTIVGVVLNGSHEPGHLEEMERKADACPHPRFRKILQLLAAVERGSDVFGKFPDVDKLVEVRIVSVDSAMRGRGIAKALIEKSTELAKQHGYPLIRIDCTSHFSALAVARLGFDCVFKMQYEDYRRNGETVFHPEPPHKQVTTYVRRLRP